MKNLTHGIIVQTAFFSFALFWLFWFSFGNGYRLLLLILLVSSICYVVYMKTQPLGKMIIGRCLRILFFIILLSLIVNSHTRSLLHLQRYGILDQHLENYFNWDFQMKSLIDNLVYFSFYRAFVIFGNPIVYLPFVSLTITLGVYSITTSKRYDEFHRKNNVSTDDLSDGNTMESSDSLVESMNNFALCKVLLLRAKAISLLIIGILFFLLNLPSILHFFQFRNNSLTATAVVIDMSRNSSNLFVFRGMDIQYIVNNEVYHSSLEYWGIWQVGSEFSIRYNQDNPDEILRIRMYHIVARIAILGIIVVGVIIWFRKYRRIRRIIR